MLIDLHIHSTASDGVLTPEEIIVIAKKAGLTTISFTDHESVEGYKKALSCVDDSEINLISGLELTTYYNNTEIHLLGYGFDPENISLLTKLKELRTQRTNVAKQMVSKLNYHGIDLKWEEISTYFTEDIAISKGHIISSLFRLGYLKRDNHSKEFIRKYFGNNGLAYVEFESNPLDDAIELIHQAGGIAVLAHPGLIRNDQIVREILERYSIGLEVYYYYFGKKRDEWIQKYEKMAIEKGRIKTGGSDFHGIGLVELGAVNVPREAIFKLL